MPSPAEESRGLDLADLIDLEWTAHGLRTGALERDALAGRTRGATLAQHFGLEVSEAASRLASELGFRQRLCRAWLEMLRAESRLDGAPGRSVASALRAITLALTLLGLVLGVTTAAATLHYDGSRPVNVFHFVGVFFVLQIVALAVAIGVMVLGLKRGEVRLTPVGKWVGWMALRKRLPKDFVAGVQLFRGRRSLYESMQRWLLFSAVQRFGVAFNAAALVTCLCIVTFTDLAFSWSTTLDVSPRTVHAVTEALGWPFSLPILDAVPSLPVVTSSRWDRLQKEYSGQTLAQGRERSRPWWRFLLGGLIAYGLVPRTLAYLVGRSRLRHAGCSVGLDHADFQRIFESLLPLGVGFSGPQRTNPLARPDPDRRGLGGRAHAEGAFALVVWGRFSKDLEGARQLAESAFPGGSSAVVAAGTHDLEDDRRALARIAALSPVRVVVALDAGVQPTREFLRFLGDVRKNLGVGRDLCVLMTVTGAQGHHAAPDARDLADFEIKLAELGDPHLRLRGAGAAAS